MNTNELFETLSHGEFANLNLAVEGTGTILEEKKPMVLKHANDALLRLYTRFVLKEKVVMIEQFEHITNYHLLEKYSESRAPQPGVPYPYIKDAAGEHFVNDVVRIYAAFDHQGCELPLNDEDRTDSIFIPQPTMIQVPQPIRGTLLSLAYQARHPKLLVDGSVQLELPSVLEEALTAYIAYKVYTNMNTQESTAKAAEHLGRYEAICQEAADRDIVNNSISRSNTRFEKRGWV